MLCIAYLADGKVHLKLGDEPPRVVDSPFIESARRRDVSIERRNAWKREGATALVAARAGVEDATAAASYAAIVGLSRGRAPDELLYLIRTSVVAGLFAFDATSGEETRLFHGNDVRLEAAATRPGVDLVACSLRQDLAAHIAVMRADGSGLQEVTEGDSIDTAPSWVPGRGRRLVYQTAGLARDAAGRIVGVGPSAIDELDLERGAIRTLAESPAHDLLAPQVADDGALYYVRRPWNARSGFAPLRLLLDLLLLPFRLLAALFHWLNFFTVRYSGRPLIGSPGTPQRQVDARQWLAWSNVLGAAHRARLDPGAQDADSTAPASWQLVRQGASGLEVLVRGVRAFDLTAAGVVYSTGSAIHHRRADGTDVRLCTGSRIGQVVALS